MSPDRAARWAITLPSGMRVSGRAYMAALERAKAAPETVFRLGSSGESMKGREFVALVRRGVHDHINRRAGLQPIGRKDSSDYWAALRRAESRLNCRGRLYRDDPPELLRRFPDRVR